jgi:hypothetical protein
VRVLRLAGFANQKYEGKPPAIIVESSYAQRYTFDRFKITTDAKSFARGERPQASSDYKEFVCNQIEDNAEKAQFDLGNCKQYFGTGFIWVQDECPNAGEHTGPSIRRMRQSISTYSIGRTSNGAGRYTRRLCCGRNSRIP